MAVLDAERHCEGGDMRACIEIVLRTNARINEMPHPPPLQGQGGALALVCQILRPRGWEICRNLYLFIREHVVSTFDPGGGSFDHR